MRLSLVPLLLFPLVACDDIVHVRNLPPTVALDGLCQEGDRWFFQLRVQDLEAQDVDVEIRVGGRPALIGPLRDGPFGLRADRDFPGLYHWLEWAETDCLPDSACPTAVCATLEGDAEATAGCVKRSEGELAADVVITAADSRDKVSEIAVGRGDVVELGACDFSLGARE